MILLASFFFGGCHAEHKTPAAAGGLRPWLSQTGKFGYRDSSGRWVIAPRYDDATLFYNGYAVVGLKGSYGVIDSRGRRVIPLDYPVASLLTRENITLVVTKKEYNAWWHFWQWKWWPEWSILGGKGGPALVTRVPRARWEIRALPGKKVLFSRRQTDDKDAWGTSRYWKKGWVADRSLPADIPITYLNGLLSVGHKVFAKKEGSSYRTLSTRLRSFTADSNLFVGKGDAYSVIDENGKSVGPERYRPERGITFLTASDQRVFVPQKDERLNYRIVAQDIFSDRKGNLFLAPDFTDPFPRVVRDYHGAGGSYTAKEIFDHLVLMSSRLPAKGYWVVSGADSGTGTRCFLLQPDGTWNTTIPLLKGADQMMTDGSITFDRSRVKGVLDSSLAFLSMPLSYIMPCSGNPSWFMGKDTASGRYGVYDCRLGRWQVPPRYSYLQQEISPGVAIYSVVHTDTAGAETERFGLIDIRSGKEITPPVYDRIDDDGRVTRTLAGKRVSYYLDPITGREYRM